MNRKLVPGPRFASLLAFGVLGFVGSGCGADELATPTRPAMSQLGLPIGESPREIVLRSGAATRVLSYGRTGDFTPSAEDFLSAQLSPATIVSPNGAYIQQLPGDPAATWVAVGSSRPPASALYAVPFEVTETFIGSAQLNLLYSVDNAINGVFFNGQRVSGNSYDGDYHNQFQLVRDDIAEFLLPGTQNWMYIMLSDYGGDAAIAFSAKITIEGSNRLLSLRPTRAGNRGAATFTINGAFQEEPTSIRLVNEDGSVIDSDTITRTGASSLQATFDLVGAEIGPKDVVIPFPTRSLQTLAGAVEIVPGAEGGLEVSVLGPSTVRANRSATFLTILKNSGLNDIGPIVTTTAALSDPGAAQSVAPLTAAAALSSPIVVPRIPVGGAVTLPSEYAFPGGCSTIRAEAEDPCEPERIDVALAEADIENQRALIDHLLTSYDRMECQGAGLGTPVCVGLTAQIHQAREHLDKLYASLAEAERRLEICLQQIRGASRFAGGTRVSKRTASALVCAITSWDPNDKVGADGAGESHYLSSRDVLPYTVYFENKAQASAAAQEVFIMDFLPENLDLDTLAFGTVRIGDRTIGVPRDNADFSMILDMRPDQELLVEIQGQLNYLTRVLEWQFRSLDPATGEPTMDPFAGFLPPNLMPPQGEGSVSFDISPQPGLASGTTISNGASIVFDTNEPILTPIWWNTIDAVAPSSAVSALPEVSYGTSFSVRWNGSDDLSGVKDYSILVSKDAGPFEPWMNEATATSAVFQGEDGHTYEFVSVARDFVGNVETPGSSLIAFTSVSADLVPPECSATVTPDVGGAWHASDATVRVVAVDSAGGSGVVSITFEASGSQPIASTEVPGGQAEVVINTEGETTLRYHATDVAGNVSETQMLSVKVDKTAPILSCKAYPEHLWPANGRFYPVSTSVRVTEAGSGGNVFELTSVTSSDPGASRDVLGFRLGKSDLYGMLRAESRRHSSRVYALEYSATDRAGNIGKCQVEVIVSKPTKRSPR